MAVTSSDPRRANVLLSRLHFLVRLVGLLGVQAFLVGLVLVQPRSLEELEKTLLLSDMGSILLAGGLAAALFSLLIELLVILRVVAGRRSALSLNSLLQILLALLLLIGVNVLAFQHPKRWDWTREQLFTLPENVRTALASLDPDTQTTIVLFLMHRTSSFAGEKPDLFDLEAERKVVEKVKDLVELFREVGPQFRVEVLDVADRGFNDRLQSLTKDSPELRAAIEQAPQNSIFLHAGKSVQRMNFDEFYRLDRTESEKQDNLVLRAVGPGPLTRRVVHVEERQPRIGILVFHEALSSEGPINIFTLAGARKALTSAGFEIRDVVLRGLNGEPTADALAVTKLGRLQEELDDLDAEIRATQREIQLLEKLVSELNTGKLPAIQRLVLEYAEQFNPQFLLVRITESNREAAARLFANQLVAAREGLVLAREERGTVAKELASLAGDQLAEQRRLKDLKGKLSRLVADVDLLFIPRLTLLQNGEPISNPSFHDLDSRHAEAVREFLKQGKPVFACLGPTNMPSSGPDPTSRAIKPPDELERMLAELGILFGKRTVLFNVEKRAFAGRGENILRASKPLQVPPLRLDRAGRNLLEQLQQRSWSPLREATALLGTAPGNPLLAIPFLQIADPVLPPNPVRESLRLADRESGRRLDLRARFLRPLFLDPLKSHLLTYDPEVLATTESTWHDEQPFRTARRPVPRFEPPAPDDPDNGTLEARRRGPFSVGVAVEMKLPPDWAADRTVRVAALGQPTLFTGPELSPGQQRLLIDTMNWLLGRDEQLAQPAPAWSYPRVPMSEQARMLWQWGARWGLPEIFAFLGLVMLLIRRLR